MYERYGTEGENTSIDISKGKLAKEKRYYDIAFFQESSEQLRVFKETKRALVIDIFTFLLWIITVTSFGVLVLFIIGMK